MNPGLFSRCTSTRLDRAGKAHKIRVDRAGDRLRPCHWGRKRPVVRRLGLEIFWNASEHSSTFAIDLRL